MKSARGLFRGEYTPVPRDVSAQLDSLRGMSALAVLAGHANQIIVGPSDSSLFAAFGLLAQAAVMMFFALSGFLICKSITRNTARFSRFSPAAYAADRFNRIAPPLAFSVLLVTVLWALAPFVFPTGTHLFAAVRPFSARSGFDVSLRDAIGSVLFVNGFLTGTINANGPLWSLSYEVWYYVAAGLIAALPGRKGLIAAAVLMGGLAVYSRTFVILSTVWFAGALVALTPAYDARLGRIARAVGAAALALAAWQGFVWLRSGVDAASPDDMAGEVIRGYNLAIGIFFAAMLYLIAHGRLRAPVFAAKSAGYTYTLYIVHFPILLFVYGAIEPHIDGWPGASWLAALGAALGCWGFAWAIAPWLEGRKPVRVSETVPAATV